MSTWQNKKYEIYFFSNYLKYVLIPFYVIGVVYASVMYDVTVGVDIGIRYPAQKDDTTHKLRIDKLQKHLCIYAQFWQNKINIFGKGK